MQNFKSYEIQYLILPTQTIDFTYVMRNLQNLSTILGKIENILELSSQWSQFTPEATNIGIWHAAPTQKCKNAWASPNAVFYRFKNAQRALILQNLLPGREIFNVFRALLLLRKLHHRGAHSNDKTHIFPTNFV